jgi:hypothetical protein
MKKLMLLGAMVAAVLVAAAPAFAQVNQPFSEKRITSGKSSPSFDVSNKGNNANLCPTGEQVGQTGNVANEQGVNQYRDRTGDINFTGSDITVTPDVTGTCNQTIQKTVATPAPQPQPSPSSSPTPSSSAAPSGAAAPRLLPATGGITGSASLLGLGAGALLVAGGLIARRIIR